MTDSLAKIKQILQNSSRELSDVKKKLDTPARDPHPGDSQNHSPKPPAKNSQDFDREELKSLLENLPEMVFIIDREGNFVYVNSRCTKLTGYTREKLLSMSMFNLVIPEFHTGLREKIGAEKKPAEPFEVKINNAEGEQINIQLSINAINDNEGRTTGIEGIAWDITLERNMERQLIHAQKMEAIGTLAGGIAHDFNNLLTIILGNLEMVKIATPLENRITNYLFTIEKAGIRAKDLVKQLLQFGKPDKTKKEVICLNKMVEEASRFLRAVIPTTIDIEINLSTESCPIETMPSVITQIITNLCINARDAMPRGGRLLLQTEMVNIDEEYCKSNIDAKCGKFCMLRVSDTGKGMAPQVIERMFEPFYTTKMRSSGAGLGLAVVYTIVKRMGGWINVTSEMGLGTEFTVYLPTSYDEPEKPLEDKLTIKGGEETILFAEDEEMILELGREILEHVGYTVLEARDTASVLAHFNEKPHSIDLLILDLTMPGEGGIYVLDEVHKIDAHLPVIIASGYSEEHYSTDFLDKASSFIPKPYTPVQLAEVVRQVLDKKKAGQA